MNIFLTCLTKYYLVPNGMYGKFEDLLVLLGHAQFCACLVYGVLRL